MSQTGAGLPQIDAMVAPLHTGGGFAGEKIGVGVFYRGRLAPGAALTPEVLEPIRGQLGVAHRVLDVLVAEPSL